MSCTYSGLIFISCILLPSCIAVDKITASQFLKDPETIVSNNRAFELGFFSPTNSTNRYVGIWYSKISNENVIWVANRNNPVNDSSKGVIRLSKDGNLQVLNAQNQTLWSSNLNLSGHSNSPPVAQLLDSGNLVVQGVNGKILWQSFEQPSDTAMPNMQLTVTEDSGLKNMLQSWKGPSDPSTGRFSIGIDSFAFPQLVIWDRDQPYWRSGPWIGNNFIGMQNNDPKNIINAGFNMENDRQGSISLTYYADNMFSSDYVLSYQGTFTQRWWDESKRDWKVICQAPEKRCDFYGTCGAFGSCNANTAPICQCLKGFEPKNKLEWSKGNWTSGCIRRTPLQCGKGSSKQDGFLRVTTVKVPDQADWSAGLNKDECRGNCLNNCSCVAYTFVTAAGCMSWGRDLVDIQVLPTGGVDLYLRLAESELGNSSKVVVIIAVCTGSLGAAFIIIIIVLWRSKPQKQGRKLQRKKTMSDANQAKLEEVPLFKYEELEMATNYFHDSTRLGRGGFGVVYKGRLDDGQEVAVKRLSEVSGQGEEEFRNEVLTISKLQHRNLVRLLGCCIEGNEKMLIYEYMPNKSLDSFLFDPDKQKLLSWKKRHDIIQGICRGLLYLHRDSRLKIIHRDLKASNILLDENLNPKISDFGMARIFSGNQDQDDTRRVAGTYGYMSPEYAMGGQFSEKSDVFSFGVLLLEIVSGKRNSLFSYSNKEEYLSLIGYAYKLWEEDRTWSLVDPIIAETCFLGEIQKCIQVGLLCVQESTTDRPSISTVLSMLGSETSKLPRPKSPGFIHRQITIEVGSSSQQSQLSSANYASTTVLGAR